MTEIKPLEEKIFYYVSIPWNGEPKVRHNYKSAKEEAKRLALKLWVEVLILQSHKSYKLWEFVETNFVQEPNKKAKEDFCKNY